MQTTNISNSFKNTPIYNRNIFLALSILTMVAIFVLSSFPGNESNQMSDLPATIIADSIPSLSEFSVLIARKMAHFTEYMVLGFFMALYTRGSKKELAIVFIVGFLFAVSDEIHQYFVPSRYCQLKDVLIDSAGVLTGILSSEAVRIFLLKKNPKKEKIIALGE